MEPWWNSGKMSGFSILELLVALVVVSIGSLALFSGAKSANINQHDASHRQEIAVVMESAYESIKRIEDVGRLRRLDTTWFTGREQGKYQVTVKGRTPSPSIAEGSLYPDQTLDLLAQVDFQVALYSPGRSREDGSSLAATALFKGNQ